MRAAQNMQIHKFFLSAKWTHHIMYTSHKTLYSVNPRQKKVHHSADRSSGVFFLTASGFLRQKTDLEMTMGGTVRSVYIQYIFFEANVLQ